METKNLRQVNLATISESELLEAARQGRLFIAPAITDYSERKAESIAQITKLLISLMYKTIFVHICFCSFMESMNKTL